MENNLADLINEDSDDYSLYEACFENIKNEVNFNVDHYGNAFTDNDKNFSKQTKNENIKKCLNEYLENINSGKYKWNVFAILFLIEKGAYLSKIISSNIYKQDDEYIFLATKDIVATKIIQQLAEESYSNKYGSEYSEDYGVDEKFE